ncbi:unnamed protein product [Arabis nemorensis]|uniref:Protein kinase domain-containing protein n=1 Tax=Arabis nemorensis TaxID=586526 RepID=A0A565BHM2_9BRAS|nr:unnamed protein product [Arabis nemorensis]
MAAARSPPMTGCESFTCGNLDFQFPFFATNMPSRCGLFMMNCDQEIPEIQLEENGKWYEFKSISQAETLTITDPRLNQSLVTGSCSDLSSFSLPDSPWFGFSTLYKCNTGRENGFTYENCRGGSNNVYYSDLGDDSGCLAINVPQTWLIPTIGSQPYVSATFSLPIELPRGCFACYNRGGECKMINNKFCCVGGTKGMDTIKLIHYFCNSACKTFGYDNNSICRCYFADVDQEKKIKLGLGLGGSAGLTVMIIILVLAIIMRAKNARKSDWNGKNVEAIVMLKRYSYAKVKKMTNSFTHVLGKGGFGIVYKGKLPDGGLDIAVKILKEANGNGEDFINEVASMSRTSHVNIVPLLGFCYEGNKRAIIYEFMPNGSLHEFISNNMSMKMEWERLYDIAVGVSRGLEYLHNRCVTRIVHFDIKPQNILMDKDFCPKIADFGLAKLWKNKESIMSMLDARGTVGYIAPEVFFKNFGVSHKSDVYSYGMVVLEMIGAKNIKKVEHSESNNSSMYFPDWIYKDFERGEIMTIFGDQITKEEEKIAKKMVLVGLWCIQTNPSDRPPMIKVIEMLEGNLDALQVPPKPLLCLPMATVPETIEDSLDHETSSFSNPSQFARPTLSACEDNLRLSKEVFQPTVEASQHSSRC